MSITPEEKANKFSNFSQLGHEWRFPSDVSSERIQYLRRVLGGNLGGLIVDTPILTTSPGDRVITQRDQLEAGQKEKDTFSISAGDNQSDVEVTISEMRALAYEEFGLPDLHSIGVRDFSRIGRASNPTYGIEYRTPDLKASLKNALIRNSYQGRTGEGIDGLRQEDIEFRTINYRELSRRPRAVVAGIVNMWDRADGWKKGLSKTTLSWLADLLRIKYGEAQVDVRLISLYNEAQIVSEPRLFQNTQLFKASLASGYEAVNNLITGEFGISRPDVYIMHETDYGGGADDAARCGEFIGEMLESSQRIRWFGFGHIAERGRRNSFELINTLQRIKDPRVVTATIDGKHDAAKLLL